MTLAQALALVQERKNTGRRRKIFLVCGFQPLHLATFLQAHFAERFPDEAADIHTGLYGDFEQTLDLAAGSQAEAAAVAIEWSDLDSRLGLRSSGGWGPSLYEDILATCRDRWSRILAKLEALASKMPVSITVPTLPPVSFGYTTGWQMSPVEIELEHQAIEFCAAAGRFPLLSIVNRARLDRLSPLTGRLDAKMELGSGFPYSIGHASAVALQLIRLLYPPNPMKGLITDLDDTLWSGLVGEIGAMAVTWSLENHSQLHGLYQQELRKLAEMGVLLAIASKNDAAVAQEALRRSDLYVSCESFFPVCADWNPKSVSVRAILDAWNIGPESVVFVDDSRMELEEVRAVFPSMTCLEFPAGQPAKAFQFLEGLRDLFGKTEIRTEDRLRQSSVRAGVLVKESARKSSNGNFIRELKGIVTFDTRKQISNKRLLELINKTNQFNLNGTRISEGEWIRHLAEPSNFVMGVSYEDKFGPLGVIGVVAGQQAGNRLDVSTWVMSCRAFSRRIEHHVLRRLFDSGVESVALSFQPTERNGPVQQFLQSIGASAEQAEPCVISRSQFFRGEHELPHSVAVIETPSGQ